jgi:hypothetical protein
VVGDEHVDLGAQPPDRVQRGDADRRHGTDFVADGSDGLLVQAGRATVTAA